jgi:tetratricopeptide (TPR) repeat protein
MFLTRLLAAVARAPSLASRRTRALEAVGEAGRLLRAGDAAAARARFDEALADFRALHAAHALPAELVTTYVRILVDRGEHPEAAAVAQDAAKAHPHAADAWVCLGLARYAEHRYGEALESFDRAIAAGGASAELHTHRATALQNLGRLEDALVAYDRALELEPNHGLARFHRSLARLLSGDFAHAWEDYEIRLRSADLAPRPHRYPRWTGPGTGARTVLVYGEQGLGDEIMFASCIADLLRSGVQCVLECHPRLQRLFARSFPDAVVYAASPDKRMPHDIDARQIDAEVPIGSLPLHFRDSPQAFPRHRGYLHGAPERVAFWRARLDALGDGLNIGISWKGGTHASRAPLRSIDLAQWEPILRTPGARFVSLQYTQDAAQELRALEASHGIRIEHWSEAISDYDETAALVTALDLTISVCTSIVHLAGALGRPVWVLAPSNPEWRYGSAGDAMAWYPSARMFRQARAGEWNTVITDVESTLRDPKTWNTAGLDRLGARDFRAAQLFFERALGTAPQLAEAHSNLAIALLEQGREDAGERSLRAAIAIDPKLGAARENLAVLHSARFEHAEAAKAWDEVLALDPAHAGAHLARAFLALREGDFESANALHARALELGADRTAVLLQEASALALRGRSGEAGRLFDEIGERLREEGADEAQHAELDWARSLCALAGGDFAQGWPLFEARLRRRVESPRRPYRYAAWDGGRVAGSLLIMGEQGLGDEIMFASCYPDAIERAGRAVIECEPRLAALFERSFPGVPVVPHSRSTPVAHPLPGHEIACQVHAGSLPTFFRREAAAFPARTRYLRADTARTRVWHSRLRPTGNERVVGVAWSGGLRHTRGALRSIAPEAFAELLRARGAGNELRFVSLQHDDDGRIASIISSHAGVSLEVFPSALADMDETAALMSALDAVATVCSTVVHLAGALGVPTFVLTPAVAEWRYLHAGSSMPWYRSVHLLRQTQPGDWRDVIAAARARIEHVEPSRVD